VRQDQLDLADLPLRDENFSRLFTAALTKLVAFGSQFLFVRHRGKTSDRPHESSTARSVVLGFVQLFACGFLRN
jgi:hypothetical protein